MALLELLKYLRAQIELEFNFRPPEPVDPFVPRAAGLGPPVDAGVVLQAYLAEVKGRFSRATAEIGKLANARAMAVAVRNPPAVQPIRGLPNNAPAHFEERLLLDIQAGGGRNSLGAGLAAGSVDPATVADKVDAIAQLRRADDVVIRVLAARHAAGLTGRPIHEFLALHRVEGNLDVPPSTDSLDLGVPSASAEAPTSIFYYVRKADQSIVWPHLIWLSTALGKYGREFIEFPPVAPKTEFDVKEPAVIDWAVHLCGLDQLQKLYLLGRKPGQEMTVAFGAWSDSNWKKARLSSTPAEAEKRWASLVDNLALKEVPTAGSGVIRAAPKDPVKFAGGLLAEAQAMLLATRQAGNTVDMPMSYYLYHAGSDNAILHLARALVEVHAKAPAGFRLLVDEIRADAAFAAKLKELRKVRTIQSTNRVLAELWSIREDTIAWIDAKIPTRFNLIAKFFENADMDTWNTWTEHRGNLSRYMVLLDYYQRLFA